MGEYRYAGGSPQEDPAGGLVRPGDVREFDADPGWGVWELQPGEPEGAESPAEPPVTPAPAPEPDRPPAASTEPFEADSGPEPAPDPEGA